MQSWIEVDARGQDFLVRSGTGIVTAVTAASEGILRLDLACDPAPGRPRSLRYTAHPTLADDSALAELAGQCEAEAWPVEWTVEWHRLPHIPAHIPIVSLDLKTDATATLVSLQRVLTDADIDVEVPDHVPTSWGR